MTRNIATVTRKGQVTIPIEIRRSLGISEGDRIEFLEANDGIRIVPVPSERRQGPLADLPADSVVRRVSEIAARFRPERPITLDEIEEAAAQGWTERERRYLEQRRRHEAG